MNTHNVRVKTAATETTETRVEGTKVNTGLTADQFQDVCKFVIDNGQFIGPCGLSWRDLIYFEEIIDPCEDNETRKIFTLNHWPVALYEFDLGYTVTVEAKKLLADLAGGSHE
ncbi:hypothetical protein [Pantoea ananatis]|uniref:hypothetical protein n=1 Tax=Pantoea ananas TaxID=553 RepID=UPI0025C7F33F|nr:hypothetical protein [Pantoea ananatis]MDN4129623.1 hypothetical protein [Pantoea ananatis]